MIYELVATDLSGLGGPMGSERTWTMFRYFFSTAEKAKKFAQNHYASRTHGKELSWLPGVAGHGELDGWTTGDLGWVMYDVTSVVVIE